MKKSVKILLAVVILAAVAAGGFFAGRASVGASSDSVSIAVSGQTFYATVKQIGDSWLLVEGLEVNDVNHRGAFTLSVSEDTKLVWHYTELLFEELKVGQNVAVTYTGVVQESYPARLPSVLRIELLDDDKEDPAVIVTDIVDRAESGEINTGCALEGFWQDEEYAYYFPSIASHDIIVHYSDGTQENVLDALEAGHVTIADLDRFGIQYYKESKK